MQELTVIDTSKETLTRLLYTIRYGRKFKLLNIDESLSDTLISRNKDSTEKEIFKLIGSCKSQDDFANKIRDYLKAKDRNTYAGALLVGNLTGKYVFNDFFYESLKGIDIDAFSKDNNHLLSDLRSHFSEYIINNNKRKNTFAERLRVGESTIKDLSQDVDEKRLTGDFDRILNGDETDDPFFKPKIVMDYLLKTVGVYSQEDIQKNFDFVLYDMNNRSEMNLDDRRKKFMLHKNLTNNQLKKIDEVNLLKQRLQNIKNIDSKELLIRLCNIEQSLDENISELEDI